MIASPPSTSVRAALDQLRTELIDLAFELEARHQFEAADLALAMSARLAAISASAEDVPSS